MTDFASPISWTTMSARIFGRSKVRGLVRLVLLFATAAACAMGGNADNIHRRIGSSHVAGGGLVHSGRLPNVLLGVVHASRLRLRGGAGSKDKLEMVTTEHKSGKRQVGIREDTGILANNYWAARGMGDLLPLKLDEIALRKKKNKMTSEDIFLDNAAIMEMNTKEAANKSSALAGLRTSLENDLLDLKEAKDAGDVDAEAAVWEVERRIEGLAVIERELQLARRYAKKDAVLRGDDGEEFAVVKSHSPWVDLLETKHIDDVAQWELGLRNGSSLSRYATPWSAVCISQHLELESERRATHNENFKMDKYMGTVRARDPLPRSGVHYFEVIVTGEGRQAGESLGGGTYVGLVDGNVTDWDGCWEMEGHLPPEAPLVAGMREIDRRKHVMALHDACAREKGEVTWAGGLRKPWVNGSSYGHGDRVGFLVNMDTRTVRVYKNGEFLGRAWGDLPDEVYPMATLLFPGSSAEISFPRMDEEVQGEMRLSALYLEHLATLPPPKEELPPVEKMILDVKKYRKPLVKLVKKRRDRHKSKVKGKKWNINTASDYIRMHKCQFALWGFGARKKPPVTRFVNEDGVKLVMRGDGTIPPRTEEEDAELLAKGVLSEEGVLVVPGVAAAAEGDGSEGGEEREVQKEKEKKKSLPWKLYRKEQKRLRRAQKIMKTSEKREESDRIKRLKGMKRPTDAVLPNPLENRQRLPMEYYGIKKPRAVNNANRAAKVAQRAIRAASGELHRLKGR